MLHSIYPNGSLSQLADQSCTCPPNLYCTALKVPQPLAIHLLEVTLYAVHIPPQNPHISCPTNVKCLVRCSNLIKIYMHILTEHAISLSRFPAFLRPRGEKRETFHPLVLPIHTADHSPPPDFCTSRRNCPCTYRTTICNSIEHYIDNVVVVVLPGFRAAPELSTKKFEFRNKST